MEGINKKDDLNCASCLNDLGADGYVSALGQDWHKECFRCSACDVLLSNWYFEKSGLLFCHDDYWAKFGESCQHCAQVMTGPVMSAGAHRFHPECFACGACGAHIEDGEPYALLERSKLYCGGCYNKEASNQMAGHSIRALTVPRDALTRKGDNKGPMQSCSHNVRDKLSVLARGVLRAAISVCIQLACHRFDSSCGLLTLQFGDRILEINGTPVRNRPAHEIEKVLACSDTVLQLTIEHDPETASSQHNQTCNLSIEETKQKQALYIPDEELTSQDIPNRNNVDIPRREILNIPEVDSGGSKDNCANVPKIEIADAEDRLGRRERLFKRKGDGLGKVRMMKKKQTPSSPLLGDKERSSSMSKLLDVVDNASNEDIGVLCDLSRARSFRAHHDTGQKVFRACDLLQGELLGSGFFGEVYRVTHRDTGEVMVLKQLYRVDEDAQRNFLKEVAVLRSLSHPNVLRFIGVLYKDKRLHLVTEYVAGGTLQQLLQDEGVSLSWWVRTRLARDIAAGVGYLHRMNVIHRDLNSHNCLVREDKTVIVADFGLARIVQRTASSAPHHHHHATMRRKRYTVVGNPYWMAPEMMNGNLYDEKVDVFSFGIILCEIIGRVQADPDFLPRRGDFGLNETQFLDKFCAGCPEPFYRIAFLACHLDPDHRPPLEVMEIWLESLVLHLSGGRPPPDNLLADIVQYSRRPPHAPHAPPTPRSPRTPHAPRSPRTPHTHATPERRALENAGIFCPAAPALLKSKSNVAMPQDQECVLKEDSSNGRALGKCVSASHICQSQRPIVTVTNLSRSQNALVNTPTGYILRAEGRNINITKVDDITEWIDPLPLKRTSPDSHLNNLVREHTNKTRKVEENQQEPVEYDSNLPSFLRNQSVEGLESQSKHDIDAPLPFCRHISIPDNCEAEDGNNDSDSSDDDHTDMCNWYKNVSSFRKLEKMDVDQSKNILAGMVKKGENLLGKKSSYDITNVNVRNPDCLKGTERKIPEIDCKRLNNVDYVNKSPMLVADTKNVLKVAPQKIDKSVEKSNNFFTKKLLSPKLSRLFKPNTAEVQRNKPEADENRDEKSRSKFFVHRPASPGNICRTYRIRPIVHEANVNYNEPKNKIQNNLLKSEIKLANMGKPMTPIFRRHIPTERNDFMDGRFSYRDHRTRYDKNPDLNCADASRNRMKSFPLNIKSDIEKKLPLARTANNIPIVAHVNVKDKPLHSTSKINHNVCKTDNKEVPVKRREPGISRSNYVSLANLKINSKGKDLEQTVKPTDEDMLKESVPMERVI